MLKSPLRLLFLALVLVLATVACTSADTDDTVTDDVASDGFTPPPVDDGGEPAEINPELVDQLGFSLTGAQLDAGSVTCMIDRADGDVTLTDALTGPGEPGYVFSDQSFTALTTAVHACIDNEMLAESLLAFSGLPSDDPQTTDFAACVQEQLDDTGTGDLAYVGLSALLVQFPVPAGATDAAADAARQCVPKEGVANQFAGAAEQAQQFTVDVDRECVADGIDDAFLDSYWPNLISGEGNDLLDKIESCTTPYDSGLAKELPTGWEPWSGDGALAEVDPSVRNGAYSEAPPLTIDSSNSYTAVLTTEDGEIQIALNADAPETVNNFVSLARDGFYDRTVFHRVLDGFMAQGGDPTGTGSGGPGYSFPDEESAMTALESRGVLAMANSGPDTNGSQFFITFDPTPHLTGLHAVLGEVVGGDDVLAQIDLRDPAAPTSRGEMLISVEIIEE
jgi:cyclophilin family peptidyl-prolyl cis-trans isomerase